MPALLWFHQRSVRYALSRLKLVDTGFEVGDPAAKLVVGCVGGNIGHFVTLSS
jgi:hypothetical protein